MDLEASPATPCLTIASHHRYPHHHPHDLLRQRSTNRRSSPEESCLRILRNLITSLQEMGIVAPSALCAATVYCLARDFPSWGLKLVTDDTRRLSSSSGSEASPPATAAAPSFALRCLPPLNNLLIVYRKCTEGVAPVADTGSPSTPTTRPGFTSNPSSSPPPQTTTPSPGARIYIDFDWRQRFNLHRRTSEFEAYFQKLPPFLIALEESLPQILRSSFENIATCFRQLEMPLPPWRSPQLLTEAYLRAHQTAVDALPLFRALFANIRTTLRRPVLSICPTPMTTPMPTRPADPVPPSPVILSALRKGTPTSSGPSLRISFDLRGEERPPEATEKPTPNPPIPIMTALSLAGEQPIKDEAGEEPMASVPEEPGLSSFPASIIQFFRQNNPLGMSPAAVAVTPHEEDAIAKKTDASAVEASLAAQYTPSLKRNSSLRLEKSASFGTSMASPTLPFPTAATAATAPTTTATPTVAPNPIPSFLAALDEEWHHEPLRSLSDDVLLLLEQVLPHKYVPREIYATQFQSHPSTPTSAPASSIPTTTVAAKWATLHRAAQLNDDFDFEKVPPPSSPTTAPSLLSQQLSPTTMNFRRFLPW